MISLNSTLFHACIAGNLNEVKNILSSLSAGQISLSDECGMTPLHYAAANGHADIVSLLIKRCCALACRNKDGKTAFEVSTEPCIQKMLLRPISGSSRFQQKPHFFNSQAFGVWRYIVNPYRLIECDYYERDGVQDRRKFTLKWLQEAITNQDERDLIISYFDLAFNEDSAKPMLMALTEETLFLQLINNALISEPENRQFSKYELHGPLLIVRNLFKTIYDGRHSDNYDEKPLFARTTMTREEIKWYEDRENKSPLSLKIFWSTTKNRDIANKMPGNVTFILNPKEPTTQRTLCMETLSGYPAEEEVLVAPMTKMKISSVSRLARGRFEISISFWDW